MADPLSIVAGSVGIISAALKLGDAITTFIHTTREARAELSATKSELSNLCTLLSLIKKDSEQETSDPAALPEGLRIHICAILDSCNKDITELTEVLEKHNSRVAGVRW